MKKIDVSTKKSGIVSFNDYRDTVRSALLLERIANEVKNDQIKKVDIEKFDRIMNNLSDDKRKIASLMFEQILTIFKNQKTNSPVERVGENFNYDFTNIN